jgi:ABC-type multidrug transport system ATPase subunit
MLLASPDIVVLDEATSALDSTNEAAIQQALAQAMSGRTALVIAHRLSTVRQADTILVVEAGRIVESGTHEDLVSRSGRYAELYATQFASELILGRAGTAASIKSPLRYATFERSTSARSLDRALSGSNRPITRRHS